MLKSLFLAASVLVSAPVAAQVVTYPTELVDNSPGDGQITLKSFASKVTPPVPYNTVVNICGKQGDVYTYSVAPNPCPTGQKFGVNLSGCEFGSDTAQCPTNADIDWYQKVGFTIIRIPVKDIHLTNATYRDRIAAVVVYAQSKGLDVIIDRHDYKYHAPVDAINFWSQVLPHFPAETMIELANEPVNNYPAGNKWDLAAAALNPTVVGLRDAGFTNRILFGWPGYSAVFRVDKKEPANRASESFLTALDRAGGLHDPLNRTFASGHRYFNEGASGTVAGCNSDSDGRIPEYAAALRSRGLKGYVTEFAYGKNAGIYESCINTSKLFMDALRANSDVVLGTTVWGGGRTWKEDYIFKVEPLKGTRDTAPESEYIRSVTGK